MKFDKTEVFNFEGALRGARNPMNSWNKSDSYYKYGSSSNNPREYIIGENDMKLLQKLILAGTSHGKFLRQIFVSVDITAPLYWYKEFDTYKVGTVANSTSTMHKLANTPITLDCFEIDDYNGILEIFKGNDVIDPENLNSCIVNIIDMLEVLRLKYLETNDKRYWKELIRWLPESWLQTRTITMSYENVRSMIEQRSNHKLTEWSVNFIEWCKELPYAKELLFIGGSK